MHRPLKLVWSPTKKCGSGSNFTALGPLTKCWETAQAVEAGTGILGGVKGRCPVVQEWGQEGQGTAGAELSKGRKE